VCPQALIDPSLDACDLVDPFIGCRACDLPVPHGVAGRWWTAKPPIGNTHPGATLPFGMVSVCAYSGGYVTGYGQYAVSLDGTPPQELFPVHGALGLAHFQQSGTGRIRVYYNYLLTTPLLSDELDQRYDVQTLVDETASPGVYSGRFLERDVRFSAVASTRGVRHRYTFPAESQPTVVVDVSAGGLLIDTMSTYPQGGSMKIESPERVSGTVIMEGVPLHFTCHCKGGVASLWQDDKVLEGEAEFNLGLDKLKFQPSFGYVFTASSPEMELDFAFSLQCEDRASTVADALGAKSFGDIEGEARSVWDEVFSKVSVSGGSDADRQVFYTALYRSSIKPADFKNENPFRHQDGPFFFDLSTLWDLYKTHLPLTMTLWPERGADFVEFLCEVAKREGGFPVSYLMDSSPDRFTKQATGLCHLIMEDARLRGIDADWDAILKLLWKTSRSGKGRKGKFGEYERSKVVAPLSHTLDIADAHFCMARMARSSGEQIIHDKAAELSRYWVNAFDPATGLLKEGSTYYEGENWNYSFRFVHDMPERIAIAGGTEKFVALLDLFFGFTEPAAGQRVFHFEGLNNEPDMEAPYAYIYAGRHDRTAEIVQLVMRKRFGIGRGGLPGNEDSGALSSWFVWSAFGLFPVTAQPIMLIGSPLFESATMNVGKGQFKISAPDPDPQKPFIASAALNGKPLHRAWLKLEEFTAGGHLELERSAAPTDFGSTYLPPNFAP